MIFGIYLRYIKTYRGFNYIPIVSNNKFCGLVGDNGIGKSSVLEALDAYFNGKPLNLNIATKKSGFSETKPHVLPIILLKKTDVPPQLEALSETLSTLAIQISEADVHSSHKSHIRKFIAHRAQSISKFDMENSLLIPLGIDWEGELTLSMFNCRKLVELHCGADADPEQTTLTDAQVKEFTTLLEFVKDSVEYIYIPKEIDPESFTKLERAEIQALMGESLNQILETRVTAATVQDINRNLNAFLETLTAELVDYSYRTPTDRQQNLRKGDVYNLIVQAFFNIRKLHRKQGESWLEINLLSSGEKQKAIIDVAHSLITNHRGRADNVILAVDEPESSLHMSACFDQFDALYEISKACRQLIFSTHWYGFFPTIEKGSATVISRKDGEHVVDLIDLANHREQVKQMAGSSKGALPYDIRLKSINDFVQSIITSAIGDAPYSWIVCEGSSEKLYLSAYYADLIEAKRLRIIPVGGAKEVKRLYQHLAVSYEEFKDEITGKIILLSDTDAELVNYDVKTFPNLYCRRIVNIEDSKETRLVAIQSNPVSPKTEIEDVLNGKLFYDTLKMFVADHPSLSFLNECEEAADEPSYFALDLRSSERKAVEVFFDEGNNKFEFAAMYVKNMAAETTVPQWIREIRGWLE